MLIFSAMDLLKISSRVSIYNFSSWYESSSIRIFSGFSCVAQCFVNTISCMNPHIFGVWIFTVEYPWWMTIILLVWSFSLIVPFILHQNSRKDNSTSALFEKHCWRKVRKKRFRFFTETCCNRIGSWLK